VIRASIIDLRSRSQTSSRDVLEIPAQNSAAPRQREVVERAGSVQNGRDHAHAPPAQVEADLDEQNLDRPCDTEQATSHINPSQKSSVETWLEGTARAGSPELGTPESARDMKPISATNLQPPSTTRVAETSSTIKKEDASPPIRKDTTKQKKRLSVSPFAQSLGTKAKGFKKHSEEMTAFQRWAQAIMNLPGETPVTISVKKPTNHVNIFGWRE
jgi:hypothetical protein